MPRACASRRKFSCASAAATSQITLLGTASSKRIQTSKTSGLTLKVLWNAQNTKLALGQAALQPGGRRRRDAALVIVGLKAIRQIDDPLGVVLRRVRRNYERVGDDVVDEGSTGTARIAEVADLDRCGTLGEGQEAAVLRVAPQVDQDIDLSPVYLPAERLVGEGRNVGETVESGHHALALRAAIVCRGGKSVDLAEGAIVCLDKTRSQKGDRMCLEVGRQVAHPQTSLAYTCSWDDGFGRGASLVLTIAFRDPALQCRVVKNGQSGKDVAVAVKQRVV